MNATQAQAALKKLYGKNAAWRRDETAPVGEEREAINATLPDLSTAVNAAKAARDAKRAELLKDPVYLQLVTEYNTAEQAHANALSNYHRNRVTVGKLSNGAGLSFFHVTGQGDNWQDAIDAAKAKATP